MAEEKTIGALLTELQETKTAIKNSIEGKLGAGTLAAVPFTEYDKKITAIESGGGGKDEALLEFIDTLLKRDTKNDIELTIPDGITYLGENCLDSWWHKNNLKGLYKIDLNDVTKMDNFALQNNQNLQFVQADNLESIYYDSLYNCVKLVNLKFPKLKHTEGNAFRNCTLLKVIELDSIETLYGNSFQSCPAFDTLVIRSNSVCVLKSIFPTSVTHFADGTASIYVPDDLVEQYKVTTNWVNHADIIKPLSEYTE
jgi:hypothetical protein